MNTNIPESVLVWKFAGKPGNLRSENHYSTTNNGNGYSMRNRQVNKNLTYWKQDLGINIGYQEVNNRPEQELDHKIHFRLPDGKEREILTGESVAFGIGGGDAFLRYTHRTYGINLDWYGIPVSPEDPSHQWRIYGPTGEKGKPIPTNSWVALLNEKVEPEPDFFIYFSRPGAASIGWVSSKSLKEQAMGWVTNEAKSALMKRLLG